MTQEFKEQLLNFLTGKLRIGNLNNVETFDFIKKVDKSLWQEYLPKTYQKFNIEDIVQFPEAISDKFVAYGGYVDEQDKVNGYICLLDNNFKPIKMFTEFNTGTKLRYIQCLFIEDDGMVVAIDDTTFTYDDYLSTNKSYSSEKRFIMLNNFSVKSTLLNDYYLDLRRSYILTEGYRNFYCRKIYKNPNESTYCFVGMNLYSNTNVATTKVIQAKINVGEESVWQKWEIGDTNNVFEYSGSYIKYVDSKLLCKVLCSTTIDSDMSSKITLFTINDTELSKETIYTINEALFGSSIVGQKQVVFTENEVMFVVDNQNTTVDDTSKRFRIELLKYDFATKMITSIFSENIDNQLNNEYIFKRKILLSSIENKIYILYCKDDDEDGLADYYLFRYENKWSPILVCENQPCSITTLNFVSTYKYNLHSFYFFNFPYTSMTDFWNHVLVKEIYNPNYYSGSEYIDKNLLVSKDIVLFQEEEPVFARNLYNRTLDENTSVSSYEVPNNYLNDFVINKKENYSQTNLLLNLNNDQLEKNIYETVYLHFINSFVVADRNDQNNTKINSPASSYLNYAINNADYDNAKLYSKIIINYQDGSTKEDRYTLRKINKTGVDLVFLINVDKRINTVDFVSSDKTTVYQKLDLSNLEIGKSYFISQNLEVI